MTMCGRTQDGVHGGGAAFRTLVRHADLPPRVYELLSGLLGHCRVYFSQAVPNALDDVGNALFLLAERASSNVLQQQHLESSREIKLGRDKVTPRFLQHVESTLAGVRAEHTPARAAPAEPRGIGPRAVLELVEASALDEDIGLRELSSKAEVRHSQALHMLTHRMAVIAGSPIWSVDSVPLGPAQFAAAFRHALLVLELPVASRLLAYRHFDAVAMQPIAAFYDGVNRYLETQHVLPNLRPQTGYRRGESSPAGSGASAPAGEASADHDARAATAAPSAAPQAFASTPASASEHTSDAALFTTLRDLLADRRQRSGDDHPPTHAAFAASGERLQSLLGNLQRRALADPEAASRHDSEHLRNTLMVKLRRASAQGQPMDLSEEDSDTVDLIGMLFDQMADDLRMGSDARALLTRLHVPVLRVALNDKTFFTRRDHPARELLNTIGETAVHWINGQDTDADLIRRMQQVVDHVSTDFDGDVGVFETLLSDLSRHMQALARRAELAERRHVEAARSRDKLDIARETARAAIERIVQTHKPGRIARSLLEQAWMDVLALTVLRHGADSEEFQLRVKIAGKLARHPPQAAHDGQLRGELDGGLRQVGMHEGDLPDVLDPLFLPVAPTPEKTRHADEVLATRARLGGEATAKEAPGPLPASAPVPLTAVERTTLAELRHLPFGTWFEFAATGPGPAIRRKLAWYSTVSGRCLFLNSNGGHAASLSLEQLARDMVGGRARVYVHERVSLIDRAWKAVVGALGSHAPAPTAATA